MAPAELGVEEVKEEQADLKTTRVDQAQLKFTRVELIEPKTTSVDLLVQGISKMAQAEQMTTTAKVDETGDHQGRAEDHSRADRTKDHQARSVGAGDHLGRLHTGQLLTASVAVTGQAESSRMTPLTRQAENSGISGETQVTTVVKTGQIGSSGITSVVETGQAGNLQAGAKGSGVDS